MGNLHHSYVRFLDSKWSSNNTGSCGFAEIVRSVVMGLGQNNAWYALNCIIQTKIATRQPGREKQFFCSSNEKHTVKNIFTRGMLIASLTLLLQPSPLHGKGFPLPPTRDPVVRATSPSTAIKTVGISQEFCGGPNKPFTEALYPVQ